MIVWSGGQTGADRGGLIAARLCGVEHGGWVPRGRKAEDGCVPLEFNQLKEHPSPDYPPRTYANVRDSDGTLLIARLPLKGGSQLTLDYAHDLDKPICRFDAQSVLDRGKHPFLVSSLCEWAARHEINVLNIAGSRESSVNGLQAAVADLIERFLRERRAATTP